LEIKLERKNKNSIDFSNLLWEFSANISDCCTKSGDRNRFNFEKKDFLLHRLSVNKVPAKKNETDGICELTNSEVEKNSPCIMRFCRRQFPKLMIKDSSMVTLGNRMVHHHTGPQRVST